MTNVLQDRVIRSDVKPFSKEEMEVIATDYFRDGFRRIPNILEPDEIEALKVAIDRVFADPARKASHNLYSDGIAVCLFECDEVFEDMLTREPIISLIEHILGPKCHLMANNVVRNPRGVAIDNFHVDDVVIVPLPEGIPRHDPRMRMPHVCTVQIPLTDVDDVKYGPSEYVPGSQYSGRDPNNTKTPEFEGRKPVPVLCKAGDIYLHDGQCWHRGAPNNSDRVRYLFQLSYSKRWVSQRFYPFVNYQLPQGVYDRADERRRRVLGFHGKGPYG